MLRVTVIGRSGCGKTSLINAFVQRRIAEDAAFQPTMRPELYYRTVKINAELAADVKTDTTVIVELEDLPQLVGVDKKPTGLGYYLNLEKKDRQDSEPYHSVPKPFEMFKVPPYYVGSTIHRPVAPARMGYVFLFDLTDRASFKEASSSISYFKEALDDNKVSDEETGSRFKAHRFYTSWGRRRTS